MTANKNSQNLATNVGLLRTRVTRYAVYGALIGLLLIIAATLVTAHSLIGDMSFSANIQAQRSYSMLWLVDALPIIFAFWGHRVGTAITKEAGDTERTVELRARAAALEIKAIHDANHDALTDLPNRILFRDRVEQSLYSAARDQRFCAVLLLDLDRFKEINDTIGHINGDRVIKAGGDAPGVANSRHRHLVAHGRR